MIIRHTHNKFFVVKSFIVSIELDFNWLNILGAFLQMGE